MAMAIYSSKPTYRCVSDLNIRWEYKSHDMREISKYATQLTGLNDRLILKGNYMYISFN